MWDNTALNHKTKWIFEITIIENIINDKSYGLDFFFQRFNQNPLHFKIPFHEEKSLRLFRGFIFYKFSKGSPEIYCALWVVKNLFSLIFETA